MRTESCLTMLARFTSFFFSFFFAVIKNIFSVVLLFIVHTTEPVTNLSVALISGRAQNEVLDMPNEKGLEPKGQVRAIKSDFLLSDCGVWKICASRLAWILRLSS